MISCYGCTQGKCTWNIGKYLIRAHHSGWTPNPGVADGYLMKHHRKSGGFCWSNHAIRVHANIENGEYRCEWRQWEHTGTSCNF
jgi:hypothetical protein